MALMRCVLYRGCLSSCCVIISLSDHDTEIWVEVVAMVYIAAQVSLTCGGWAWVGSAHWGLFPQAGRPAAPSAAGENPCVARTASNACRCGSSRRAHPLGAGVVRRHVRLHCRASLGRRAGPLTLVSRPLDEHRRRPFKTLVSCVGRLVAGRLTTRMSTHNNWDVPRPPGCRVPTTATNADVGCRADNSILLYWERPRGQPTSSRGRRARAYR